MEIDTEDNPYYFEYYLKITGWGFYNTFILGFMCLCNFIHGITFIMIPLTTALLTCDRERISETILLRIFTGYYIGCCFGGLIITFLADKYGRKKYLIYTFLLNFFSTFAAAFTYEPYILVTAAIFLGVGLQSNQIIAKILLAEILPSKSRGYYILWSHLFWTLGYILTTILTIILAPLSSIPPIVKDLPQNMDFRLKPWRVMFAMCGGLNLLLACLCALIEESPRYYLQSGRTFMAHLILKQFFAINRSDYAEHFKVKEEDLRNLIYTYNLGYNESTSWENFKRLLCRFGKSWKLMFSKRFFCTTIILLLIKSSVITVGFLQLNTIISKMLAAKEDIKTDDDLVKISYQTLDFICPILTLSYDNGKSVKQSSICTLTKDNKTAIFYKNYLLFTCAVFPGLLIALCNIDCIGRKKLLYTSFFLLGGLFVVLFFVEKAIIQLLIACAIIVAVSVVIWTVFVIDIELYPTVIRGTACSVTNFLGLLLVIFFINFLKIDWITFNIIMGIVYFCMSIFSCALPEMKGQPMVE